MKTDRNVEGFQGTGTKSVFVLIQSELLNSFWDKDDCLRV